MNNLIILLIFITQVYSSNYLFITNKLDDVNMPANNRLVQIMIDESVNHNITFIPRDKIVDNIHSSYEGIFEEYGIHVNYNKPFTQLVQETYFEKVYMYLWFWTKNTVPETYYLTLKKYSPNTKIVVLTDDVHYQRHNLISYYVDHYKLFDIFPKFKKDSVSSQTIYSRELFTYEIADEIIAITDRDRELIRDRLSNANKKILVNYFRFNQNLKKDFVPFNERDGIVFLGYGGNPTNRLGLEWFFKGIYNLIPTIPIKLIGSPPKDGYKGLMDNYEFEIVGKLNEDDLVDVISHCKNYVCTNYCINWNKYKDFLGTRIHYSHSINKCVGEWFVLE